MDTSRAPLAQSEDFDNLSLRSAGIRASIPDKDPDKNHNVPLSPRKRPSPPLSSSNNNVPVKRPFPTKVDSFQHIERDNASFCNPAFLIALVYFCGAMFFLVGMNVKGLTLLRYPWIGNLLSYEFQDLDFYNGVIILQVMWCFHFIRRCAQTLFLKRYHGKIVCVLFMCMLLYHSIFAFWIGWSLNYYLSYSVPKPWFLVPGTIIFIVGEVGDFYCHWLMRNTRIQPSGILAQTSSGLKPTLPDSILFKYDRYPQFIFEVVSFVGFYLSSHTIASGAFLIATVVYVVSLTLISYFQLKKNYALINNNPPPWQNNTTHPTY